MNCPSCGKELKARTKDSVQVEECSNCGGAWFDKGELEKAEELALPDARWLEFNLWKDSDGLRFSWGERKCPRCGREMAQIAYGDTNVIVDYCVDQHGIFLDQGEFENIIAALEKEITQMGESDYLRAAIEEGKEIITGEDRLPSGWKDFTTLMRLFQYRVLADHPSLAEAMVALNASSPFK